MGYYTNYKLRVQNITEQEGDRLIAVLNEKSLMGYAFGDYFYHKTRQLAFDCSYEECTWYDHVEDMMEISALFPKAIFKLSGEGQNQGDVWNDYYKNGTRESCGYQIIEEKPKHIRWNDPLEAELDIEEGECK